MPIESGPIMTTSYEKRSDITGDVEFFLDFFLNTHTIINR